MRTVLGIIGILAGIVLGVYVGVWLCLAGGIIGLVTAGKILLLTGTIKGGLIALSIIKMVCACALGCISGYALIVPSFLILIGNK